MCWRGGISTEVRLEFGKPRVPRGATTEGATSLQVAVVCSEPAVKGHLCIWVSYLQEAAGLLLWHMGHVVCTGLSSETQFN